MSGREALAKQQEETDKQKQETDKHIEVDRGDILYIRKEMRQHKTEVEKAINSISQGSGSQGSGPPGIGGSFLGQADRLQQERVDELEEKVRRLEDRVSNGSYINQQSTSNTHMSAARYMKKATISLRDCTTTSGQIQRCLFLFWFLPVTDERVTQLIFETLQ